MHIPQYHRLKKQLYRLEGNVCRECSHKFFPARIVCPDCKSRQLEPFQFSGRGEIYSFTRGTLKSHYAQEGPIALIKLEEGVTILSQLTDVDYDQISFGMKVEMVIRKIREYGPNGLLIYGHKFRPILN